MSMAIDSDFHNVASFPGVFMDAGITDITNSVATVDLDTEVFDPDENYAVAAGVITVTAGGYFHIAYSIPVNDEGTSGGTRARVYAYVEVDDGEGYDIVAQSYGQDYAREASGGEGVNSSFLCLLGDGDLVRLRVIQSGTTALASESGQSQLSMHRVRRGA